MKLTTNLLDLRTLGPNIWVIVVTGGPVSGKSTGMARTVKKLSDRGYKVLVKPETATKLMAGGIKPQELTTLQFQREVMLDTLMEEQRFFAAAQYYRDLGFKVVILCDRGAMDNAAYMSPEQFEAILKELDLTVEDICSNRYHAALHLRTAALGAEEAYNRSVANNPTRIESSAEDARQVDERTLQAWVRHHHPRVVDNSAGSDEEGFNKKMDRLFAEICTVLGDPVPMEKERKFLIKRPDLAKLGVPYVGSEIIQDYLLQPIMGEERRVRARGGKNGWTYFYTMKQEVTEGERLEMETIVGKLEYESHLVSYDPEFQTLKKTRVCFFWNERFFELDMFLQPSADECLIEVEDSTVPGDIGFPPSITVIKEVTGDKRYSNKMIAKHGFPKLKQP